MAGRKFEPRLSPHQGADQRGRRRTCCRGCTGGCTKTSHLCVRQVVRQRAPQSMVHVRGTKREPLPMGARGNPLCADSRSLFQRCNYIINSPPAQTARRENTTMANGCASRGDLPPSDRGKSNLTLTKATFSALQRFADHILRFPCRPWLKGHTAPVIASHSQGPLSVCLSRDGIAREPLEVGARGDAVSPGAAKSLGALHGPEGGRRRGSCELRGHRRAGDKEVSTDGAALRVPHARTRAQGGGRSA